MLLPAVVVTLPRSPPTSRVRSATSASRATSRVPPHTSESVHARPHQDQHTRQDERHAAFMRTRPELLLSPVGDCGWIVVFPVPRGSSATPTPHLCRSAAQFVRTHVEADRRDAGRCVRMYDQYEPTAVCVTMVTEPSSATSRPWPRAAAMRQAAPIPPPLNVREPRERTPRHARKGGRMLRHGNQTNGHVRKIGDER